MRGRRTISNWTTPGNTTYYPKRPFAGAATLNRTVAASRPRAGYPVAGADLSGRPAGGYLVAGSLAAIRKQART